MPGFYLPSEDEFDPSSDDFVLRSVSKERRYKHFDLPLRESEREREFDFSHEKSVHRFWPLLGFTDLARRYVRIKNEDGNWKRNANGGIVKEVVEKPRPIRFAGHQDAAYLQAYATHLNAFYERAETVSNLGVPIPRTSLRPNKSQSSRGNAGCQARLTWAETPRFETVSNDPAAVDHRPAGFRPVSGFRFPRGLLGD